jgi:hypothetical protein
MVDKVNGSPREDVWFERDVQFLQIASDATDFEVADFGVDGPVELVIRVLQTRGTVVGVARGDDQTLHVILGHAAGALGGADTLGNANGVNAIAELKADLDAIPGLGTFTLTLGTKWATV